MKQKKWTETTAIAGSKQTAMCHFVYKATLQTADASEYTLFFI